MNTTFRALCYSSWPLVMSLALVFIGYSSSSADQGGTEALVRAAHVVPNMVCQDGVNGASLGVQAVLAASYLATGNRQLVTTGTITQTGTTIYGPSYSYNPSPVDKLVLKSQDGRPFEFTVITIQGDYSAVENFFSSDHQLKLRVVQGKHVKLEIESTKRAGNRWGKANGKVVYDGVAYTVDLAFQWYESSDIDRTGVQYKYAYGATGTIKASKFNLAVKERWDSEFVMYEGDSASYDVRQIGSVLKLGGDTYQWVNVRLQKSFRGGQASHTDTYWDAVGEIRRNGEAYGRYYKSEKTMPGPYGIQVYVTFNVEVPGGDVEIESWPTY